MFLSFGKPEEVSKVAISKKLDPECYFDIVAK